MSRCVVVFIISLSGFMSYIFHCKWCWSCQWRYSAWSLFTTMIGDHWLTISLMAGHSEYWQHSSQLLGINKCLYIFRQVGSLSRIMVVLALNSSSIHVVD